MDRTLDHKIFNYVVIGFSVGVIALTLLFWPVAAILRKHYAKPLILSEPARRARTLMHVVCFVAVAFLIGGAFLLNDLEKPGGLGSAGDFKIRLLQIVGLLTGIGAVIAIYNACEILGRCPAVVLVQNLERFTGRCVCRLLLVHLPLASSKFQFGILKPIRIVLRRKTCYFVPDLY